METTNRSHPIGKYPLHMYKIAPCMYSKNQKLYVSFAKYRLFYRALLQKRPRISRSLPPATTACFSRSIEPGVAEDKSFMCTNKSLHFPEI